MNTSYRTLRRSLPRLGLALALGILLTSALLISARALTDQRLDRVDPAQAATATAQSDRPIAAEVQPTPASTPPPTADAQPAAVVALLPAAGPNANNAALQVAKSVSTEPLLGGAIGFGISVRNTSSQGILEQNKAYNVTVSDTLPVEVTFASASPAPSRVVRNPNGTTTIYWINVTDLDEGQSTSFSIQATIKPTVTVGMPIVNRAGGEANTIPDNSGSYIWASAVATGTAQPIDIEKAVQQSTSVNQATGASGWESTAPGTDPNVAQWPFRYRLTVQNNNVGPTSNVLVTDTLAAGVAYLGPTTISPNPNGASTAPAMTVLADGRLQLVWNLGTLTTAQYTTPVVFDFPVAIPYRQRLGAPPSPCTGTRIPNSSSPSDLGCFDGAIIADGQAYSNTYDALGIYNGSPAGDGSTLTPQDDSPVNVTAKYQTIDKSVTPGVVGYNDIVNYTLRWYVSEYYTVTDDVITDVLPDGINYVAGSASMTPTSVTYNTPGAGQTTLTWNVPNTMTTPGLNSALTFRGVITTNYATGNRPPIVALDGLANRVDITGTWHSAVSPTLTGLTSDGAGAGVTTRSPQIDKKVKNSAGIFVDGPISATVGDLLDFRLVYTAPLNMDAKDNYLADFLPRGMSFVSQTFCGYVGTISNTFTFTDTFTSADQDNDPCTYQQFTLAGLNALRWNFGFVPTNFAMEVVIQARVDNVPEVADGVIVANFLKLSGRSTQGSVYSLRDDVVVNYVEPHLNLLKSVVPLTPAAGGDTVTYTIQIGNSGSNTAFNSIVTDTIPSYIKVNLGSCVGSPAAASCSVQSGSPTLGNGGVISWTVLPAIAPAASQWLTYTATISPGVTTGMYLTNTATVGYNSAPDNSGRVYSGTTNIADDNTDDAVVLIATPQITKAAAPDPVTIGDVVTYTLTVTVPQGVRMPSARITDTLTQDGLRYNGVVTQTVSGAPATPVQITTSTVITNSPAPGMTLGWSLGDVDNSNSTTQPYVFKVVFSATVTGLNDAGTGWVLFPPGANDTAPDAATLVWSNPAGPQSAASSTTTTNIDQPLLRTTKTANRTTNLFGGDVVTYTIRVTNTGYSPAYTLVLTDVVPAGIRFTAPISYTADAGAQAGTGGVLTFTMPYSLAVGESSAFVFTGTLAVQLPAGAVLTNTADADWASLPGANPDRRIYDDSVQEAGYISDTATLSVSIAPALTSKAVSPVTTNTSTSIRIGDVVTYTIINTVPPNAVGYWPYQTDYLQEGLRYITGSFTFAAAPTLTTTLVTSGTAPTGAGYSIVQGGNPSGFNPNVGRRANSTTPIPQALEWWLTPIVNSTAVTQFITITFQAQFVGVDMAGSTVSLAATSTPARSNNEALSWNRSDAGVYTTTNAVTTTATIVNTYIGQPNLSLNKTALTPPAGVIVGGGQFITYTLLVTNNGYAPAYDVVLTETLPVSTTFVAVAIGSSNYPATTPPFTSSLVAVPVIGSTSTITIGIDQILGRGNTPGMVSGNNTSNKVLNLILTVLTDPLIGARTTLINSARVGYFDSQPDAGIDWDNDPTTPAQRTYGATTSVSVSHQTATPTLAKSAAPTTPTIGEQVVFTLTAPATAITSTLFDVVLTDTVDSRLRVDAASFSGGGGGALLRAGNSVTVTWTSILSNTQGTVVITSTVLNLITNTFGVVVPNTGRLTYASTPGGALNPPLTATANVTLVEPQVTLAKSVTSLRHPVGAGDLVTYTLALSNTGANASPAYELTITDALPSGVSFVAMQQFTVTNPTSATLSGGASPWTVSQLNPGGRVTVTFTAQVDPAIGANLLLTNTAQAYYSSLPGTSADERAYTTPLASRALTTAAPALAKSAAPTPPTIGEQVVFTLTAPSVPLTATLYDVTLTDTVDSRLRVDATSFSGGVGGVQLQNGNAITLTWTRIPNDTQATVWITATVLDVGSNVAGAVVANTGRLTYASTPGGALNPPLTATANVTLVEPQVTLAKSVTSLRHPVGAGDLVTYTLALSNTGANASPAYELTITDALPSGASFVVMQQFTVTNPTSATLSGGASPWTVSQLNPGGRITITFTALVDPAIGASLTLTNTAQAIYSSLPGASSDERAYTTTLASRALTSGRPAFSLTKTAAPSPAIAGMPLTYTIQITQTGIVTATGVVITDVVPLDTTFLSATNPHTGPDANRVLTWTVGNLDVNASRTFTMAVSVNAESTVTQLSNTVQVSSTSDVTATATVTTPLAILADLSITKSDFPDPVIAGTGLTYTLVITNSGPAVAQNVVVTDTLPAGVTLVSATPAYTAPSGQVVWSLGALAVNATRTLTVAVTVNSDVTTTLTNRAVITSTTTDPNGDNNTATEPTTVNTWADLSITKSDSPDPVTAGTGLIYTLVITNSGPSVAQDVVVTDTLPAGVTLLAAAPAYTAPPGKVVWSLGALAVNETRILIVTVRVNSDVTTTLTNRAVITSTTPDPNDGNNAATEPTAVNVSADLRITKSDAPDPVLAGETLTYTLHVTNNGPSDAQDVIVTDTLPVSVTFAGADPALSSGPPSPLTWSLGTLAAGAERIITLMVTVDPAAAGVITNTATVTSTMPDPNNSNNAATEPTTISASADLRITKSDAPDPVRAGEMLTYTLVITNRGPSNASGVLVTDTLPVSVAFSSATPGYNGPNPLVWNVGDLGVGVSRAFTVAVVVDFAATGSITNTATVGGDQADPTPDNNSVDEPTTINPQGTLVVDVFNDGNGNGVHDPGEGLPGIQVVITPSVGAPFTVTTDANGMYTVTVPAGNTGVDVDDASLPVGLVQTVGQDPTTVSVPPGGIATDINGYQQAGSIGDLVWWDINGDGLQDPGEPGIPDVDLLLSGGASLATTTDASGLYTFANLVANPYTVTVAVSEFITPGGTLYNWTPTYTPTLPVLLNVGQVVTNTDFGFNISRSYTLTKQLNTPTTVRTGDVVSFTIRITNTGNSWIAYLPLRDTYSNTYLTYSFATPQAEDLVDDGTLNWGDLTQAAPDGFGTALAPGASFAITVTFTAREDTTALPDHVTVNTATVYDAYVDPDGPGPLAGTPQASLPQQSASASVEILRSTGIGVIDFKVVMAGRNAVLTWQTASESDIAGFNILRRANGGEERAVNGELIFAEHAGANRGAQYRFAESDLPIGAHVYLLEAIGLDGRARRVGEFAVSAK